MGAGGTETRADARLSGSVQLEAVDDSSWDPTSLRAPSEGISLVIDEDFVEKKLNNVFWFVELEDCFFISNQI